MKASAMKVAQCHILQIAISQQANAIHVGPVIGVLPVRINVQVIATRLMAQRHVIKQQVNALNVIMVIGVMIAQTNAVKDVHIQRIQEDANKQAETAQEHVKKVIGINIVIQRVQQDANRKAVISYRETARNVKWAKPEVIVVKTVHLNVKFRIIRTVI